MLVLSRKSGEQLQIGEDITIMRCLKSKKATHANRHRVLRPCDHYCVLQAELPQNAALPPRPPASWPRAKPGSPRPLKQLLCQLSARRLIFDDRRQIEQKVGRQRAQTVRSVRAGFSELSFHQRQFVHFDVPPTPIAPAARLQLFDRDLRRRRLCTGVFNTSERSTTAWQAIANVSCAR